MFYKGVRIMHIEILALITAILIVFISYVILWEFGSRVDLKMDEVNSLSKSDSSHVLNSIKLSE